MAYIMPPNPAWANLKDCVEFPCTAPANILFTFKNTKYNVGSLVNFGPEFQVIANNTGISPFIPDCTPYTYMNAYICHRKSLGVLLFESEDPDTKDRSM